MTDVIELRPFRDHDDTELLASALPCPFCGSGELTTTDWFGDDGEFTAIACRDCMAEAPATTWNRRAGS